MVEAGTPVLVLESMKMETVLVAPFAARVRELMVVTGGQVETGMPLLRLEPLDEDEGAAPAEGADATARTACATGDADSRATARPPPRGPAQPAPRLRPGARMTAGAPRGVRAAPRRVAVRRPGTASAELDVVRAFSDLCELTRNKPAAEETADERVHSPREYFHSYLHSLDVDREHLPETFRERLPSCCRTTASPTSSGRQRWRKRSSGSSSPSTQHLPPARRHGVAPTVDGGPASSGQLGEVAHDVLDRFVVATQLRYPVVGDLARSVRFRWFDQPVVEAARAA